VAAAAARRAAPPAAAAVARGVYTAPTPCGLEATPTCFAVEWSSGAVEKPTGGAPQICAAVSRGSYMTTLSPRMSTRGLAEEEGPAPRRLSAIGTGGTGPAASEVASWELCKPLPNATLSLVSSAEDARGPVCTSTAGRQAPAASQSSRGAAEVPHSRRTPSPFPPPDFCKVHIVHRHPHTLPWGL
jgi:hypothetical protein